MNYSEMLDFEINCSVAEVTGKHADYCNSWADAGPIIHEHGISVAFDEYEQEWVVFSKFQFDRAGWDMAVEPKIHQHNKNPLRAAMIVFLMMQEQPDA